MTRALLALAALVPALAACSPRPLTETIVVVDADPALRGFTSAVRFDLRGGPGRDPTPWPTPMMRTYPLSLPLVFGVVPQDEDASRSFEAHAVALSPSMSPVGEARVVSGFDEGKVVVLSMRIQHECNGVMCGPGMRCALGMCVPEYVDASSLPANDPTNFAGSYTVGTTVISNACMLGSDMPGAMGSGVPVTVMQMPDASVYVEVGGVFGAAYSFYVGTNAFDGFVIANHMTAVLVGTKTITTGTCTNYTLDAVVELDLSGNHASGVAYVYAVTGGRPECASVTGCVTAYALDGARM